MIRTLNNWETAQSTLWDAFFEHSPESDEDLTSRADLLALVAAISETYEADADLTHEWRSRMPEAPRHRAADDMLRASNPHPRDFAAELAAR